jgi:hypothetical protein
MGWARGRARTEANEEQGSVSSARVIPKLGSVADGAKSERKGDEQHGRDYAQHEEQGVMEE